MKFLINPILFAAIMVWLMPGWSSAQAADHCRATNKGIDNMQTRNISVVNGRGKLLELKVWIADDQRERAYGYQHICREVIARTFILFVYQSPVGGRFHMNNVKAPLDIAFFDADGVLISAQQMLTYSGAEKPLYGPDQPFQFALEARQGFLRDNHLEEDLSRLVLHSLYD